MKRFPPKIKNLRNGGEYLGSRRRQLGRNNPANTDVHVFPTGTRGYAEVGRHANFSVVRPHASARRCPVTYKHVNDEHPTRTSMSTMQKRHQRT